MDRRYGNQGSRFVRLAQNWFNNWAPRQGSQQAEHELGNRPCLLLGRPVAIFRASAQVPKMLGIATFVNWMADYEITASEPPRWLYALVSASAALSGTASFLLGLVIFAISITPDTGHGEDVGRPIAIALVLPAVVLSVLVAIVTSPTALVLRQHKRTGPIIALVLTGIGLALMALARFAFAG